MKIERAGESYFAQGLIECKLYVRKDLTVAKATEWFYTYVGENSYLPLSSLILPEDGELLQDRIEHYTGEVEMITAIADSKGGHRNIYLRLEPSEQTEEGIPLYLITLFDIRDMERRNADVEAILGKYRHFMTLNSDMANEYYFEYTVEDNKFVLYKYVNERSMVLESGPLEDFVDKMTRQYRPTQMQKEQMQTFCNYLRGVSAFFEMEFTMIQHGTESVCRVKGGCLYKYKNIVAGIFMPTQLADTTAYYLNPAARDAGTGLFNKRAVTEYTVERLTQSSGICWFVLLDIDDFKNINDSFGHLFGDRVIRKVAETLQVNVGYRGVVGRFGGDEFFAFLEKIPDRVALKNMLKTITKELAYAYDPKLKVTASIGITQYPVDGTTFEELFEKADKALYVAKEKGKDRHIIYEEKEHGSLQKDAQKTRSVTYTVSREKRRQALLEIMDNLYDRGAEYVTENPMIQKRLRDIYDLDGIAVYSDYGRKLVCRNGDYPEAAYDMYSLFQDEKYVKLYNMYGNEDILIDSANKLIKNHEQAYEQTRRQEILTSIQCLVRKESVPYAMVSFDMFNRNRKWSDTDVEMLALIGKCIGKLLCKGSN